MIRVNPKPMTTEVRAKYEAEVRYPGRKWLEENPRIEPTPDQTRPKQKRLPSHWLNVREELADAFHERCAYTAMWLSHPGQIDHFVSIDEDRSRAYDWDNFRYCAGWLNSSKKVLPSSDLLDPLSIEDDWFEVDLPSLELKVTDRCPAHARGRAELMLTRLHLRNGPQVMRYRQAFYRKYDPKDPQTLALLDEWAPLIARAIRKQAAPRNAAEPIAPSPADAPGVNPEASSHALFAGSEGAAEVLDDRRTKEQP